MDLSLRELSDVSNMDFTNLTRLRKKYQNDPWMSELLAPFEHQAYAREFAKDNPLSMGASIPLYQVYKFLSGRQEGRTPASLDQMFAGFRGMSEGLK